MRDGNVCDRSNIETKSGEKEREKEETRARCFAGERGTRIKGH